MSGPMEWMNEQPAEALQPDTDVVLQLEPLPLTTIPVRVEQVDGPIRTQGLPRKSGSTKTIAALGASPIRILRASHYRSSVTLMSIGQPLLIAFTEASASDPSTMAVWPAGTPYTCTATVEIWVAAQTGTTQLSIITENWADG
jgi:hypothetical protein